ncbi:MAG: DNA helicase RecQ [Oscillospiraceae bacterium]|nr:DNA helicase RecQ [Oscillospiraceae bacterium]
MNTVQDLKKYFGHSGFREGQSEITEQILSGRDAVGVMPTGAGKSVCYQLPALIFAQEAKGLTIVVSPLISLMKDQVTALIQLGISAEFINSSRSNSENSIALEQAAAGLVQILYVTPERLEAEDFLSLSKALKIAMLTVDEAHCISQWGQDFRPSYLKISDYIEALPARPVISAFTATATALVREDIISKLRLKSPYVITTGFDRKNLYFGVLRPKNKFSALLAILEKHKAQNCIIYCLSRNTAEEVAGHLTALGFKAACYHAGMSDSERRRNQEDFIYDRINIMTATNAFGMGIDKSDVSLVLHYNMPRNIEAYYQEAGRAGRDGSPAECLLFYSPADVRTHKFMLEKSRAENTALPNALLDEIFEKDLERLKMMTFYSTLNSCLREYILKYFGEKPPNYCGSCSSCLTSFENADITLEAQKIICCVIRAGQAGRSFGQAMVADILRGSENEKIKKFGMDKLSTYGIMSDTPVRRIRTLIDELIREDYLRVDEERYNVLVSTPRSVEFLKNKATLYMKLPKELEKADAPGAKESAPKKSAVNHAPAAIDMELFDELKKLRLKLALAAKVPAYVIFADASLRDMCVKLPRSRDDFTLVSGVGEIKAERYSGEFLNCINGYLEG